MSVLREVCHVLGASLCASACIFATVVIPLGPNVVGFVAGAFAAAVAGVISLLVSPVFLLAARHFPHWAYIYVHLIAGLLAGLLPGYENLLDKYFTVPIVVSLSASFAAWLYVVLLYPSKNRWLIATKFADHRVLFLTAGLSLLVGVAFVPPKHHEVSDACHNVFRTGRTSISPVLRMTINITDATQAEVHDFYQRFAARHQLDIAGHPVYGKLNASASMCNDWITISAGGLFPQSTSPHSLSIFEVNEGSDWQSIARSLICDIEERWPGDLMFKDGGGSAIPKPAELASDC